VNEVTQMKAVDIKHSTHFISHTNVLTEGNYNKRGNHYSSLIRSNDYAGQIKAKIHFTPHSVQLPSHALPHHQM